MGVLNFQTGRKTYTVNDGCEISFDPTDIRFVNGLFDLFEKLEKQQNEQPQNPENAFAYAAQRDRELRAQIDALFEEPVCEKIFGRTNVLSPAGGLPVALHFLLALIDEVDAAAEEETKPSAKVDAYIRKYEQKYGKYVRK